MKKIIIPIAVIAAVGLVAPKFTGNAINQGLDDLVAGINQAPGYTASIKSRDTSWFSSSAVVNVALDPELFADLSADAADTEMFENLTADINFTAQHGPFLTLNGFSIGLSAWKADVSDSVFREFLAYDEDKKFYSMEGKMGLLGGISYADNIPEFNVIADETAEDVNDTIAFSGWDGSGTMAAGESTYAGKMDSFVASGDNLGMTLEIKFVTLDMSIEGSLIDAMSNVFYDSKGKFVIGSINFDSPMSQSAGNIQNVVMDVVSEKSEDGKLMDFNMNYMVESIDVPNFKGSNLVVKTEINNLEKGFFEAYQEAVAKPAQMEQAMVAVIENNLLTQLQASPEFNITEMSGNVADGKFSGRILAKVTGIDSLPEPLEDPAFWVSKAVVDSKLTLDKAMALWLGEQVVASQIQADPSADGMTDEEIKAIAEQQVESMIGMFTQQGMITINADGDYEMTFSMQDGQALLNGNPMPIPL